MDTPSFLTRMRSTSIDQQCRICGSHAIGINFGVLSCAPCKAFFRRNARRTELLDLPCRHRPLLISMTENAYIQQRLDRYTQIRRCSSCRLRRCFEMGMREELVRTDEENKRHRDLVDLNRKRRVSSKTEFEETNEIIIMQNISHGIETSSTVDWEHLSEIMHAYDVYSIKTFLHQRSTSIFTNNMSPHDPSTIRHRSTTLTASIILSVSAFLQSLAAFRSLPSATRNYLFRTNIEPLIFPNLLELNASCFSEPWQLESYKATWQLVCGPQLYNEFEQIEAMSRKYIISDPVVTRLSMVILFFSTPLHYNPEYLTTAAVSKKNELIFEVQKFYTALLWKYLLHRYNHTEATRIFSNQIRAYLKMQDVGYRLSNHLRSQEDLAVTYAAVQKLTTLDVNDDELDMDV